MEDSVITIVGIELSIGGYMESLTRFLFML